MRLFKKKKKKDYTIVTHAHTLVSAKKKKSVNLMPCNPVNPFVPDFMLDLATA